MTKTEATAAARSFVAAVTKPDREWTLATVEKHLPPGWLLTPHADVQAFFPVTVRNVAAAIMANKEAE